MRQQLRAPVVVRAGAGRRARSARATAAVAAHAGEAEALSRRTALVAAAAAALAPPAAFAAGKREPVDYTPDTYKVLELTLKVIQSKDDSPSLPADIDAFKAAYEPWLASYKFDHGPHLDSYAYTYGAAAKVYSNMALADAKEKSFEPEHTVYNPAFLIKRCTQAKAALDRGE